MNIWHLSAWIAALSGVLCLSVVLVSNIHSAAPVEKPKVMELEAPLPRERGEELLRAIQGMDSYLESESKSWEMENAVSVMNAVEELKMTIQPLHEAAQQVVDGVQFNGLARKVELTHSEFQRQGEVVKREIELHELQKKKIALHVGEHYYRDSHGAVMSESDAEGKLWTIRKKIESMPDNAERAYMEGVLKALDVEWARIKRQGPIEQ